MARRFDEFIGNPGDVVNKAKLNNEGMATPRASPGPKIVRFLVDYNAKMDKVLAGIRAIRQGLDTVPSAQPEPRTPAPASTSQPQPDPQLPDPTLQKNIPEISINTDNIASLQQWAEGGLQDMATPMTRSQTTIVLVSQPTPGSVTKSQTRKSGVTPLSIYEQMNKQIAETEWKRAERRGKRVETEPASSSRSSSKEEEELEDHLRKSSSIKESQSEEEIKTPP